MAEPTRSATFYVSDVWEAAEIAAQAVQPHGLNDGQVEQLTERIKDAIDGYFEEVHDGS